MGWDGGGGDGDGGGGGGGKGGGGMGINSTEWLHSYLGERNQVVE